MAERLTVGVAARLSRYLQVLSQARKMGKDRISSQEIAEYTNINATQIRRDLSAFGKFGKRGVGYNIDGVAGGDPEDPPDAGAAQHRSRWSGTSRRSYRELADLRRARDHDRGGLRLRRGQGRNDDRRDPDQPAVRARRHRARSQHRGGGARRSRGVGPGRRRPGRRRRDQDRLQLLDRSHRHPRRMCRCTRRTRRSSCCTPSTST